MVIQDYDIRHLFPTPSYGYDIERYKGGREIMRAYRRRRARVRRPSARWLEIQAMEQARLAQLEQQKAREEAEQKRFEQEQLQKAFEVGRQMEARRKAEESEQTFLQRQARWVADISGPFLPLKAAQQLGLGEEIKLPPKVEAAEEVRRGLVYEFIPKTKEEVAITAATFGIGAGVGAGIRGGGALVTRFTPRAAPVISKAALVGGIGVGGIFAYRKGAEFVVAPTPEMKGEVLGRTTRELLAFGGGAWAGSKLMGKGIGLIRTRGLIEVSPKDVIAPEYFRGERFPAIRRGQTAEQLRKEFFEPVLAGERRGIPRGFTARAEPLPDLLPPSKPRKGELVGTFISPKISPAFFRVAGEAPTKLFSFKELGGLPEAVRLRPRTLELAPGVTPTQRIVRPLRVSPKELSEAIKGTGRAIIGFSKTEKEAVIGAESPLGKIGKRFFVKFEGERIPIREAEVLGTGVPKGITKKPSKTLGDLSKEIERSLRDFGKSSVFTPSRIAGYGISSSILKKTGSSIVSGLSSSMPSGIPSRPRQKTSKTYLSPCFKNAF